MKLLFISDIYPDADNPARGTFNFELCRALAVGNDVRVIAPRAWPVAVPYRLSGRTFRPRPNAGGPDVPAVYPTYWYTPMVFRERYGDFYWQSSRRAVQRLSQSFAPDAVLSYWAHPDGEAGLRAARVFGVPSAVIVGGSDVLILPDCPKRGTQVRRVLRDSDAVITISDGLRDKVIELGINPQNVHAIEQGINPDLFFPGNWRAARRQLATRHPQLNEHRPMLLWVGRMVHVKRLDVLLAAASALRRRGREFVLCLAGDGPLRDRIARMVSDRQLSDCVHFVGPLPPESLGEWYRAADVTVLSSESEGLPNVLRESLACGTPFVSTDVGSVREIADERYAVLAPSGDSQTLADGVEVVLNGPHQEHARRYEPRTWDAMAADVVSLLRQCGANGGPAQTSDEAFCHVG